MQTFQLEFESKFKNENEWIKDSDTILAYNKQDAVERFKKETENHPHLVFKNVTCSGLYHESANEIDPEEKYWKDCATYQERNTYNSY